MKTILEYSWTVNNSVYNKARKSVLENTGKINCGYCPYHRGENRQHNNSNKSWKKYRKTQYKTKGRVLR